MNSLIEDHKTEFKQCSQGRLPARFAKTVSAFSNSEGGQIICGVDDSGKSLNLDDGQLDKLQKEISSQSKSAFNHIINLQIKRANRHLFVIVDPAQSNLHPIYIKKKGINGGTYIRVGATNQLANDQILKSLLVAAAGGAEQRTFKNQKYQDNLDIELVKNYIKLLNSKSNPVYQEFDLREVLLKLQAINQVDEVSLFGLLVFGQDGRLEELLEPTICIDITLYSGIDKINPDNINETYLSSRSFRGNLKKQFEEASDYILSILPERNLIDPQTGYRQNIKNIPANAIRETLINSLAHRDYSVYGAKINVDIYSDRLEFINLGVSLVPIEHLDIAASITRNPKLLSFLKDIGLAEEKARGIRTIKSALQRAGLRNPIFENLYGQFFKVTIFSLPFVSNKDKNWLDNINNLNLKQSQMEALFYLKNNPNKRLKNSDYRRINNIESSNKATKELKQLVDKKLLKRIGKNKNCYYTLP